MQTNSIHVTILYNKNLILILLYYEWKMILGLACNNLQMSNVPIVQFIILDLVRSLKISHLNIFLLVIYITIMQITV